MKRELPPQANFDLENSTTSATVQLRSDFACNENAPETTTVYYSVFVTAETSHSVSFNVSLEKCGTSCEYQVAAHAVAAPHPRAARSTLDETVSYQVEGKCVTKLELSATVTNAEVNVPKPAKSTVSSCIPLHLGLLRTGRASLHVCALAYLVNMQYYEALVSLNQLLQIEVSSAEGSISMVQCNFSPSLCVLKVVPKF